MGRSVQRWVQAFLSLHTPQEMSGGEGGVRTHSYAEAQVVMNKALDHSRKSRL